MDENLTIRMDRPHLSDLPPVPPIPDGYEVVTYSDDRFEAWMDLLDAAFPEHAPFDREKWLERIAGGVQFRPDGVFFVRRVGSPELCATAYFWVDDPNDRELARVEWVGARTEERGRGLGRLVMILLMRYMAEAGYSRVMLETQPFRTAAINLYLSLGFEPTPKDAEHEEAWRVALARIPS